MKEFIKNILLKLKNCLKRLLNFVIIIIKLLICVRFTYLFGLWMTVVYPAEKYDWQIVFYLITSASIIIGLWMVCFMKTKLITKVIFVILFFVYFDSPKNFLPSVVKEFDKAYCFEQGRCIEGLKVNTKYGLVKINKEICLKHDWKWSEKCKFCDVKLEQIVVYH